jgi:hypothetical protein
VFSGGAASGGAASGQELLNHQGIVVERRNFLKICSAATVATIGSQLGMKSESHTPVIYEDFDAASVDLAHCAQYMASAPQISDEFPEPFQNSESCAESSHSSLQNYIARMEAFEHSHPGDFFLNAEQYRPLLLTFKRLDRVRNMVGRGNFNVISFDEIIRFSKRYSRVGQFKAGELAFFEEIFFDDAQNYGFFGEKVISELTAIVPRKERYKVPYTDHFVYRGDSLNSYTRLRQDVGNSIILTSGIRSVVKQTHLFLAKVIQSRGNLSRASRSLAPPGYSFHGVGDYDVGKVGFGQRNFTSDFARTREFKKLVKLDYIDTRYPKDNLLGVRYEPWHIKVV